MVSKYLLRKTVWYSERNFVAIISRNTPEPWTSAVIKIVFCDYSCQGNLGNKSTVFGYKMTPNVQQCTSTKALRKLKSIK